MDSKEAKEFISALEAELGSKIGYRTFATWFGSNDGLVREYGVFFCILEDGTLYFEDFERLPQILGYTLKSKNTPKYEKYSFRFRSDQIRSMSIVKKRQAQQTCASASRVPLCTAGKLSQLLFPVVTQIELDDGRCLYFELISHKEFTDALKREEEKR